jgi:Fe-S-cluster-containing hydrogenase component 2/DMSO reductase anchor subunit
VSFRQVTTFNPTHEPGLPVLHLSLACNHCEAPACMDACPTGAYSKDPTTGTVILDEQRCMGCTYCSWVCPYGAPQFDDQHGVMTKCTFCASRLEEGGLPACVVACPVEALDVLGESTPALQHDCVPGFPETGLRPAIQLVSRSRVPRWQRLEVPRLRQLHWERLHQDGPLAFFTFSTAFLVGWFLAGTLGGALPTPLVFLPLAALGGLASILHLGRPSRMWRALRNVRTSWISREVALWGSFLTAAAATFFVAPSSTPLAWLTVALGLATATAMDMVYRVPQQAVRAVPHSAMTLLTALFLAGVLGGHLWLAAPLGIAKLWLYVRRWHPDLAHLAGKSLLLPVIRLLLGFLVPAATWLVLGQPLPATVLGVLLVGEALDRLEFYAALEFLGPRRQADLDAMHRTGF